jgi:hypothetical protein
MPPLALTYRTSKRSGYSGGDILLGIGRSDGLYGFVGRRFQI